MNNGSAVNPICAGCGTEITNPYGWYTWIATKPYHLYCASKHTMIDRDAVIEECARVVEEYRGRCDNRSPLFWLHQCMKAVRALKTAPVYTQEELDAADKRADERLDRLNIVDEPPPTAPPGEPT